MKIVILFGESLKTKFYDVLNRTDNDDITTLERNYRPLGNGG